MGFNTTVVVRNDALGDIANDTEFGKKIADAVNSLRGFKGVDVSAGSSVNAATVVETHHNSSIAIVAVGGNYASILALAGDFPHHTDEGRLKCLEALASHMGFRLVKKAGA